MEAKSHRNEAAPVLTEGLDEAAAGGAADRLLEDRWSEKDRRLGSRELRAELGLSCAFLIAAVALAFLAPYHSMPLVLTAALAVSYAIASRVVFPVGAGHAVPTQLFLIPLLVVSSPADVPLVVMLALCGATLFNSLRGRTHPDRIVEVGGDAWHALGPALVFVLAGSPGPDEITWWVIAAAFIAQITCEVASGTLREWLALGIPPQLQLKVLGTVWLIDLLLTPVGLIGALATVTAPAAPVALLGVAIVLALLSRDRNQRIDQAYRRLEALRRERTRLQIAVRRIGDAFASKLDLDALLTITVRAAVEALDADGGRASAHQGTGRRLVRRATVHEDTDLEPALRAAEERALDRGAPSVAMVDGVWALASPVEAPGAVQSAGMVVLARRGGAFAEEERELLHHLCEQAGVAAGNVTRHETLHKQALTDELTGLANHRRLQELLRAGLERHQRARTPMAMILLDLDNFKQVNDLHGHQTGDRVLRAVAECLRECCRTGDEPARYGGEELAVVIQGVEFSQAVALAERTRAAVAELELVDQDGAVLHVTTSVGVAALGGGILDIETLIATADAALYRAKAEGKNCVRYGTVEQNDDFPPLRVAGL